ncbi:MAG: MFS transporter [Verrucomicrobiota bacterium]|nr:MFS transporter [Verrucomicrobiota bacterium]
MNLVDSAAHRTRTLWLVGILHAFTHVYQVVLLPAYFLIQKDFALESVDQATLLVTVMMLAYFGPSYFLGVLADRYSRKQLLAWGLALNAAGFIALSLANSYPLAILCVAISGIGGCFYHPAATALIAQLYPKGTGKALGLVGIGAGLGFFIGPLYAGWRAAISGWRAPVLELGIAGLLMAIIFAWLAEEHQRPETGNHQPSMVKVPMFPTGTLWLLFISASFAFSLRDFTGSSMGSLGSLYLQQAHSLDLRTTGATISAIFLAAALSNPIFGKLSDHGRYTWTMIVLIIASILVISFPYLPVSWAGVGLFCYGFFFMASYPTVEAALMESVPNEVRGRVFGFFITIGGFVGNLAHWLMGEWVHRLGPNATNPAAYRPIYWLLGGLVIASTLGLLFLSKLKKREMEILPPLSH